MPFSLSALLSLFLVITSSIVSASSGSAINAQFRFETLQQQKLEQISDPQGMVQDSRGFMWFAGYNGLARYDGYDIKIYRHVAGEPNSLSGNNVTDLLVDSKGRLWLTTNSGLNRYVPEKDHFIRYYNNPYEPNSLSGDNLMCLLEDKQGQIWIGTWNTGISILNPETTSFRHIRTSDLENSWMSGGPVISLMEDSRGMIWIGHAGGSAERYDPKVDKLVFSVQLSSDVQALYEDSQGLVWLGTYNNGLKSYNLDTQHLRHFSHDPKTPNSISHNAVVDIMEDRRNQLWIATDGGGVNLFDRQSEFFRQLLPVPLSDRTLSGKKVHTVYENSQGDLWFFHFPNAVTRLNRYAQAFINYVHEPGNPQSLNDNGVLSIAEDKSGNLWLGTEQGLNYLDRQKNSVQPINKQDYPNLHPVAKKPLNSVFIDGNDILWAGAYDGGLLRIDLKHGDFTHYQSEKDNPQTISNNSVWAIKEDARGQLWAATDQLNRYDVTINNFVRYPYPNYLHLPTIVGIFSFFEDSQGLVWLGSSDGLIVRNPQQGTFSYFGKKEFGSNSQQTIRAIAEDKNGDLWLAHMYEGVYRWNRKSNTLTHYNSNDGLSSDSVHGVVIDNSGHIWFSTTNGLLEMDPITESFTHYNKAYGLPGNVFNRPAFAKLSSGELAFGSTAGLTVVNPEKLVKNKLAPPVVLTGFQLFNKDVPIGASGSPLSSSIGTTKEIVLDHTQSVFSIEFSALNYRMPDKNSFAYRLEGFDEEWNNVGGRRRASYTNLPDGEYIFRVKASNNDGVWNDEGVSLSIVILPSWWRTWWAYAIYGLVSFAVIYHVYRTRIHRIELDKQKELNGELLALDKMKDDFLANTTHELRTPLNGIIGIAETLISGSAGEQSKESLKYLDIVVSSGKRLSNLVNDILDCSKLRVNKLELIKEPVEIHGLVEKCFAILSFLAAGKKIQLVNRIPQDFQQVVADAGRLEQIFINILSNGIKYSDAGEIIVSAKITGEQVAISIQDSGIGIAEKDLKRIFMPYEQVESAGRRRHGGTGLGLRLTNSLVELHGGSLSVKSQLNLGSTFTVYLPFMTEHHLELASTKREIKPVSLGGHALIVDDDAINRLVLEHLLEFIGYTSDEVGSGEEAVKKYQTTHYDLVMMDINMQGMSGLDACKVLREQLHATLPIVFLSGNSSQKDIDAAHAAGGQTLLAKPLDVEKLQKALVGIMQAAAPMNADTSTDSSLLAE